MRSQSSAHSCTKHVISHENDSSCNGIQCKQRLIMYLCLARWGCHTSKYKTKYSQEKLQSVHLYSMCWKFWHSSSGPSCSSSNARPCSSSIRALFSHQWPVRAWSLSRPRHLQNSNYHFNKKSQIMQHLRLQVTSSSLTSGNLHFKIKVLYWNLGFHEENVTFMETFHCTKSSYDKRLLKKCILRAVHWKFF